MPDKTPAAKKANYVGARPKDTSGLSTKPSQVRRRLRRSTKNPQADDRVAHDMAILYKKPIEEWDLEELAMGRARNKNGDFQGSAPKWITPRVVQEARRRLLDQTLGKMAGKIPKALEVIEGLMTSTEVDDKGKPIVDARTKLQAATFILEHFLGKPKAFVEILETEKQVRSALVPAIILDDGFPQGHLTTIEGEIVEDDELNAPMEGGGDE
ncbi:MAG: hypothetical protein ABW022_10995 [Actinoplanes sp.]